MSGLVGLIDGLAVGEIDGVVVGFEMVGEIDGEPDGEIDGEMEGVNVSDEAIARSHVHSVLFTVTLKRLPAMSCASSEVS